MTERREPPRIGTADGRPILVGEDDPAPGASRRLGRLVASPSARRLVLSRVGRAALIGLAGAVVTIAVGSSLWRGAVDWLHRRPEYQVAFKDIRLVPEPPPWIKGGREALLRDVLAGHKAMETFSILDAKFEDLLADFRLNPWIVRADRVGGGHPNLITVELDYREPVATILAGVAPYALDGEAVVLPRDGVDLAKAAPLLEISGLGPSEEPKAGLPWPARAGTSPVLIAARLARFLKHRSGRDPELADRLRLRTIVFFRADEESDREILWLLGGDATYILWGYVDRLGTPEEKWTDAGKWDALKEWAGAKGTSRPAPEREYLRFGPRGVELARFKDKAGPDPADTPGRNRRPAVPLK